MAITGITISQDNKVGNSDLLPVHSPLVFIADVSYSGATPSVIYVDVEVCGVVIETFKAIPYKDPLETLRQFCFVANDIIKGLMDSFDDTFQAMETLVHLPEITKTAKIIFYEPEKKDVMFDSVDVTFAHGAVQIGNNPNLTNIFNNSTNTYLGGFGNIVYVYFYNDDPANELTIGEPRIKEDYAQDFDDAIFDDYNDEHFTIDVSIN